MKAKHSVIRIDEAKQWNNILIYGNILFLTRKLYKYSHV